ncbi:MAG: DUF3105 domain-containing protein, partial [Dehalococcoidia bacterium]
MPGHRPAGRSRTGAPGISPTALQAARTTRSPPPPGHWGSPANWGVYPNPVAEAQVLHNLEHSGIVIWYKPDLLPEAELDALRSYVEGQLRGNRFKFILSPWAGRDFEHAIAVTAWRYLLYLDDADTGQIDAFVGTHYGRGPEPAGG